MSPRMSDLQSSDQEEEASKLFQANLETQRQLESFEMRGSGQSLSLSRSMSWDVSEVANAQMNSDYCQRPT